VPPRSADYDRLRPIATDSNLVRSQVLEESLDEPRLLVLTAKLLISLELAEGVGMPMAVEVPPPAYVPRMNTDDR